MVLGSIYFLYTATRASWRPQEDQGVIIAHRDPGAQRDASTSARSIRARSTRSASADPGDRPRLPARRAGGQSIAGYVLKPWDERTRTASSLQPICSSKLAGIAGAQVVAFQPPPLPGSNGLPLQFVINTTGPFEPSERRGAEVPAGGARQRPLHLPRHRPKIDQPQATVVIDRDKAAAARPEMSDIGGALGAMLGGGYVNYFALDGRSYKVIPQVQQCLAAQPRPAARLLHPRRRRHARCRCRRWRRSSRKAMPAVAQPLPAAQQRHHPGRAVPGRVAWARRSRRCKAIAARTLPQGYTVDYGGPSRQYVQESSGFVVTFGFALIIIFLALAALFESFRDPLIILVSVPMSIAGALIFISLGIGGATLNIYTAGRAGDADGPDQQARHPDRRVRQRAAGRGQVASARPSRRPPASACGRS